MITHHTFVLIVRKVFLLFVWFLLLFFSLLVIVLVITIVLAPMVPGFGFYIGLPPPLHHFQIQGPLTPVIPKMHWPMWVVVTTMVPFWVPSILGAQVPYSIKGPRRDHHFDNHPCEGTHGTGTLIRQQQHETWLADGNFFIKAHRPHPARSFSQFLGFVA